MKILAIDTSSKRCSVSILEDNKVLINLYNDDEKTHSVKLMPMIDEAFSNTEMRLDDIELLVCGKGPGSFTGVRIGISTIKAFADVKNIPVVGVSSLESLAYNIKSKISENTLICSLIDAKNQNVYCGLYYFCNDKCIELQMFAEDINATISKLHEAIENNISINAEIKSKISNSNQVKAILNKIIFIGDGSLAYQEIIKSSFEEKNYKIDFAIDEDNVQNGISLAIAGFNKYKDGKSGNSSSISPIYLKKSQAERALEERIQILEMTENDLKKLEPILYSDFDDFWNINNLKSDFHNDSSFYFVAKLDDELVGFAGIIKICDESNIMNIVTKNSKRHLGIGSKLLEALILKSKEISCTSITLEVNEHNTYAINLYEKFNFKRIGLRKKYYNNTDAAILMEMRI